MFILNKIKQYNAKEDNLERFQEFLKHHIDPDHGLLGNLRNRRALSSEEKEEIEICLTYRKRNLMLLKCISCNKRYEEFLLALREADQSHIANYIQNNGNYSEQIGRDWPLSEKESSILDANEESLIDIIDPDSGLLNKLYAEKVINCRQIETISSKPTCHERNSSLLSLLRRRSIRDYQKTIQCLRETNQSHVAQILDEGGVVLPVHVDIRGTDDMNDAEVQISSTLSEMILSKIPNATMEKIGQILEDVGLRVIAARKGNSVLLYIYCKTMEELNTLEQLTNSGNINSVLTKIFIFILLSMFHFDVEARIDYKKLKNAKEFFKKNLLRSSIEKETTPTDMNDLPLELHDIILQKVYLTSAVQTMSLCNQRDHDIINRMASVNFCWFKRMKGRKFKKVIWFHLSNFYKKKYGLLHLYKNNFQFLEENIELDSVLNNLKYSNCLSDVECAFLRKPKYAFFRKGRWPHQSSYFPSILKYCNEDRHLAIIQCLIKTEQKTMAKVIDSGGVVVSMRIETMKSAKKAKLTPHFLNQLNNLKDKNQSRSREVELALNDLKDNGIEILNLQEDREITGWIWCKTPKALGKLCKMNESQSLIDVFRQLTKDNLCHLKRMYIDINYNELREKFVYFPMTLAVLNDKLNLQVQSSGPVQAFGVTVLRRKMYILCQDSHLTIVNVYEDQSPFHFLSRLKLERIKEPSDIGSSEEQNSLYVVDNFQGGNNCVWKIEKAKDKQLECNENAWLKFTDFRPRTLSVLSDGQLLLVSRFSPFTLRIYGTDAKVRLSIDLEDINIMYPCHAVETVTGNFIIIHRIEDETRELEDILLVSELSRNGEMVIRRFNLQHLEKKPYFFSDYNVGYLCMYSDEVFAADTNNCTVNLLSSDFRCNRIIPSAKDDSFEWPRRMFYNEEKRLLIVVVGYRAIYFYVIIRKPSQCL